MIIRDAKQSDWHDIKNLIALYPDKLLQDHLPSYNKFVIAEDGAIVGCCALDVYSKRIAEIRSLAVRWDYQNKGIGGKMIEICLQKAKIKGLYEVITITGEENLFERHGFRTIHNNKLAMLKII